MNKKLAAFLAAFVLLVAACSNDGVSTPRTLEERLGNCSQIDLDYGSDETAAMSMSDARTQADDLLLEVATVMDELSTARGGFRNDIYPAESAYGVLWSWGVSEMDTSDSGPWNASQIVGVEHVLCYHLKGGEVAEVHWNLTGWDAKSLTANAKDLGIPTQPTPKPTPQPTPVMIFDPILAPVDGVEPCNEAEVRMVKWSEDPLTLFMVSEMYVLAIDLVSQIDTNRDDHPLAPHALIIIDKDEGSSRSTSLRDESTIREPFWNPEELVCYAADKEGDLHFGFNSKGTGIIEVAAALSRQGYLAGG